MTASSGVKSLPCCLHWRLVADLGLVLWSTDPQPINPQLPSETVTTQQCRASAGRSLCASQAEKEGCTHQEARLYTSVAWEACVCCIHCSLQALLRTFLACARNGQQVAFLQMLVPSPC